MVPIQYGSEMLESPSGNLSATEYISDSPNLVVKSQTIEIVEVI